MHSSPFILLRWCNLHDFHTDWAKGDNESKCLVDSVLFTQCILDRSTKHRRVTISLSLAGPGSNATSHKHHRLCSSHPWSPSRATSSWFVNKFAGCSLCFADPGHALWVYFWDIYSKEHKLFDKRLIFLCADFRTVFNFFFFCIFIFKWCLVCSRGATQLGYVPKPNPASDQSKPIWGVIFSTRDGSPDLVIFLILRGMTKSDGFRDYWPSRLDKWF